MQVVFDDSPFREDQTMDDVVVLVGKYKGDSVRILIHENTVMDHFGLEYDESNFYTLCLNRKDELMAFASKKYADTYDPKPKELIL